MGKLTGKVALVTGASRGIGREIAMELSKEGASVIINYSKDKEGADRTVAEILSFGGYAKAYMMDISKSSNCRLLIQEIIKDFGKIDIVINNAGRSKVGLFIDFKEDDIDDLINTNLLGAMYISKYALDNMITRGCGNIINISSIWGEVGASCEIVYSATKGSINLFTKALAKEVAPFGIRVNAIAPGVINTEMNGFLNDDERQELIDEIPQNRFGECSEVAKAVSFLCDDNCKYLTGQIIRVDGGII